MQAHALPSPVQSLLSTLDYFTPPAPLRMLLRTAGRKLRPRPPAMLFSPLAHGRAYTLLAEGRAEPRQYAEIRHDVGSGTTPTIVLGGFVPDSTDSVFLMRNFLLRQGDLYCVNYPRQGFNMDLLFAQLDDLMENLQRAGRKPVILAISFGAGLLLEWLRRHRMDGRFLAIEGIVLVSPVACTEDLIPACGGKPSTLLGRAIRPYLGDGVVSSQTIEKSRTVFRKMFDAGAQNKTAVRAIMTAHELADLHGAVVGTIAGISAEGACERVQSLKHLQSPSAYFQPGLLPLTEAPVLILYAEKEDSVLDPGSPTRFAMAAAHRAYFPVSEYHVVSSRAGSAVQHASLIFHCTHFLPFFSGFYRRMRRIQIRNAA